MKAIGVKMVDLQPMTANEAIEKGYKTNNYTDEEKGYEVTYTDGYKSWSPKAVADKTYFKLADEHGETIKQEDIERFIAKESVSVTTAGSKNTVVTLTTITGFEANGISSCVKPENYDVSIGKKFARSHAIDQIWAGLGFVLQWAKYGLTFGK